MKLRFFSPIIIAIIILVGFLTVENKQLNDKVDEMDLERIKLQAEQEMNEMSIYFASQPVSSNLAVNYDSWVRSKDVAEQLYENSEGKFLKEWGLFLGELTQKKGIDPFIVYELLKTETGGSFNTELVGPETKYGHAYGMAQFMKNTAPWIADMAGLPYEDDLLFDPLYSIQLSIEYLSYLHAKYDNWDYTLTAYHRGMYGLEAYLKKNGHAQSWYAVEIQDNANKFEAIAYK